jgi:RND family efflux transporter MFP subunit
MRVLRYLAALVGIGLIFVAGFGYGRWYSTRPAAVMQGRKVLYYVDSMHPWYRSDKPGIAPDCGMKLTAVYADGGAAGATAAASTDDTRKILRYRDPKEPAYVSDKPGMNPATGNDLEPVYADALPTGAIQVSADRQQLAGVRYGLAEVRAVTETIHAAGRVVPDERLMTRVQARAEGWITAVAADFVGKAVAKGEPLVTLYSPELVAAQSEFLLALRAKTVMRHSSMAETAGNNDSLAEAARRRLQLLNFTPEQVAELERTGKPQDSITLYAPATGYVMTRNAVKGQRVSAETELYTLADLRDVWVMAEILESDAPRVRMNQAARVLVAGSGASLFARVAFIQPQVDPVTRTMKVRLELANPGGRLRPDSFADVTFELSGAARLSVPAEAVVDTGTSQTVFMDLGNGNFMPRAVRIGERFGDRVEILQGLAAGDRIVVSGAFLLNSETQMRQP